MGFLQKLKEAIKMGDFFNSYQMLRYKQESEYRTFTGGLISLAIITTIIIGFASMILDTMNRTIINFTENSERQSDPALSVITASPENNYMFGVEVWGHNLNSEHRYFDVIFMQIESNYGQNYTSTQYPLEACTKEHWAMLPEIVSNFDRLKVGNWLCPTIGTIINLQGKYTSETYHQYSVTLYPCNNKTDPSRPCAPQEQIDQFLDSNSQWNYFTYYFVNSMINPDQTAYKSHYMEDRSYIVFGKQLGAELDLYLSEIDITSDNSIWPFSENTEEKSYFIQFNPILYPFAVSNDTSYATFYVMKDPMQHSYSRQVQKIFVIFSFMGGLIGAVMAGLFIVNTYTSFAFQLALAIDIFKDGENSTTHKTLKSESSKGSVNILHFLKYYFYMFLKKFKPDLNWPLAQYMNQCRSQILYQLDVKGLIKRIIFLQYSISYIFQDYHLFEMQNEKPYLPADVKKLRQIFQSVSVSENESEDDTILSNKPLYEQQQYAFESNNGIATNQQMATIRNHQSIFNSELLQDDKIVVEPMDASSLPKFQSKQDNCFLRKRTNNFRKLTKSAQEGNLVSKKLLQIISSRPLQFPQSRKSIQKASFKEKSFIQT